MHFSPSAVAHSSKLIQPILQPAFTLAPLPHHWWSPRPPTSNPPIFVAFCSWWFCLCRRQQADTDMCSHQEYGGLQSQGIGFCEQLCPSRGHNMHQVYKDGDNPRCLPVLPRDEHKINPLVHHLLIHPRFFLARVMSAVWKCSNFMTSNSTICCTLEYKHGW